jgi:hypothetical protein
MSLFSASSTVFNLEYNEKNKNFPFVVLIGWISSLKKHLEPYAKFYQENSMDCCYFTPPDSYHAYPTWMDGVSKELLKFIQEEPKLTNRKVFFHCFSGNGLTYSYIIQNMTKVTILKFNLQRNSPNLSWVPFLILHQHKSQWNLLTNLLHKLPTVVSLIIWLMLFFGCWMSFSWMYQK